MINFYLKFNIYHIARSLLYYYITIGQFDNKAKFDTVRGAKDDQVQSAKNYQLEPIETNLVEFSQNDLNLFLVSSSQILLTFVC